MDTASWRIVVGLVLLIGVCAPGGGQRTEGTSSRYAWAELDRRGFNAIWALRTTGDLFISNGKTIHVTRDHGATWEEPVEEQSKGRHYNSIGFDADWKGERLALFPIDSPIGWMTLDGGRNWVTFRKPEPPQVHKHDGWTYGAVHWADGEPTRLFAKEHHSTNLWLSTDAGTTWTQLGGIGGYFGIGFGTDGALLVGVTLDEKSRPPAGAARGGIYRSTDDGKTWELVCEAELDQKVKPQRFNGVLYWPTLRGLAISEDGGKTWEMMPGSPRGIGWGPFFGETADEMIVANAEGVHRTKDGGATWALIVPRRELPEPVRDADFQKLMPNFAWDPEHDILYATSMGVGLFRLALEE